MARGEPLEPLHLIDHRIERGPLDELHDVIRNAIVLAEPEDRDDVGMVQPRRGLRLTLKPHPLRGVAQHPLGEDLEGHGPAQGDLHGLVDDPHAPAADLPDDSEITESGVGRRARIREGLHGIQGPFQPGHRREDLADLVGQVRIAAHELLDVRPLAAAESRGEFVDQPFDQGLVAPPAGAGDRTHAASSSPVPSASTSLRTFRARVPPRCRPLVDARYQGGFGPVEVLGLSQEQDLTVNRLDRVS